MRNHKRGTAIVFMALLIDSMGIGVIIPVVPGLLAEVTGDIDISNGSEIGGYLGATYAVMQFLCGPIFGGLSDQFGRRPILLASLFGFGLDFLTTALAPTIWWLFGARFVAGILGASFTTGAAYISDVSTPENRSQNFGLIGMAFGIGFVFGPMIGGLLGSYGTRVPFFAAAGLSMLNCLLAFFFLPESLKPENRRKFDWKRANPFGTLKILYNNPLIRQLCLALIFVYIAAHAVQSNWTFFVVKSFNWDTKAIGLSITVVGLSFAFVQGALIRVIIPKLGQAKSVYVGLGLYGLGLLLYALATEGWMLYAFTLVYCLGSIAGPALQGIMANLVAPNAQGELQGGFSSLMSATSIVGPLLMNSWLFATFTRADAPIYFPGVGMACGALCCAIAVIISRDALKKHPIPSSPPPNAQTAAAAH